MSENLEKLYIIVLNWNGTEDTIACLKTIKNNSYNNYTIILVDNGSESESLSKLKNWCLDSFSKIVFYDEEIARKGGDDKGEMLLKNEISSERLVFIENNENLGFAKGNNVALEYILKTKSSFAMLLNNDTLIEKDSISILMNFLTNNTDFMVATPQIRYFEPNDRIWNCGGKLTFFGSRKYYYAENKISKVPQKGHSSITFVTGCALLFKFKQTGILSEDFFFGEEDYEFSLRMKKNKFKMVCVYDSIIYHKVGSSIKKSHDIIRSIYLYYINRLINTRNYYSRIRWILTKYFAYTYLPLLLFTNKINPFKSLGLIKNIDNYISKKNAVDSKEFNRIISNQL